MFRIDLYELRNCKAELENEYFQIKALMMELENLTCQIKRNMYVAELSILLEREMEVLDFRLKQIKDYIYTLEKILYIYEKEEKNIVMHAEDISERFKRIRLGINKNIYLNSMLNSIYIE